MRLDRHSLVLVVVRRLGALLPALFAISIVTFVLVRLLPGDPAELLLGPMRAPGAIEQLHERLGLDKPLTIQYVVYLKNIFAGDLGRSFFTGASVGSDLLRRTPATGELLSYSLLIALTVGLIIGTSSAFQGSTGWVARLTAPYSRLAGAFPDFWIGLLAIYVFFFRLHWAPAPLGRVGFTTTPPPEVTGFFTIDSIIAGDWLTLEDSAAHLALPALVLGLVVAPMIARTTNVAVATVLTSDYIRYSYACGLRRITIVKYVLRNAAAPIVNIIGILLVYLLGGAVLIEKVFSWPGIGLYAVQAIENADYFPIQGFVTVASVFSLLVYLFVDIVHMSLDPRVRV